MTTAYTYPVQVLRDQTTALEAALSACLAYPAPKAVHRLRTGTRRVEAQLLILAATPGLPTCREPAAELRRELRRLRRAAGAVRDLDVHRKQLEALEAPPVEAPQLEALKPEAPKPEATQLDAAPAGPEAASAKAAHEPATSAPEPHAAHLLHKGCAALLAHLQGKRDHAAGTLHALLTRRQAKAAAAAEALLQALGGTVEKKLSARALVACAETVLHRDGLLKNLKNLKNRKNLAGEGLDEDQLHSLRKSAKVARYMAETLPGNQAAAAAALGFEAVQEAGGQWHDALEITRAARKHLGKHHALTTHFVEERNRLLAGYEEVLRELAAAKGAGSAKRRTPPAKAKAAPVGKPATDAQTPRKETTRKPTPRNEPARPPRKASGSVSEAPRRQAA